MTEQITKNDYRIEETLVTPEMARLWLSADASFQRSVSEIYVANYALKMQRGEWQVTPNQSIAISKDGRVVDGQHRLRAVIKCGIPVLMSVVYDCPVDIFMATDRGRTRNLSQLAQMNGARFNNSHAISSVHALLWKIDTPSSVSSKWTEVDCLYLLRYYEKQLDIAFPVGASCSSHYRTGPFRGAVLRAAIARPERHEELLDFVKTVAHGLPLENSSIDSFMPLVLRNYMSSHGSDTRDNRHNVYLRSLKAISLALKGSKISQKTFNHSSLSTQPFPILLDEKPSCEKVEAFLEAKSS